MAQNPNRDINEKYKMKTRAIGKCWLRPTM